MRNYIAISAIIGSGILVVACSSGDDSSAAAGPGATGSAGSDADGATSNNDAAASSDDGSSTTDATASDGAGGATSDSSATDPDASTDASSESAASDSAASDASGSDAAPDSAFVATDGGCAALSLAGDTIPHSYLAENLPDPSTYTGGTIADGTYYLTAWTDYTGPGGHSGNPSKGRQKVIVISGGSFNAVESGDTTWVNCGSFTTSGNLMTQYVTVDNLGYRGTYVEPYTATATTLTIQDPGTTGWKRTYTKQ